MKNMAIQQMIYSKGKRVEKDGQISAQELRLHHLRYLSHLKLKTK